MAPRTLLSPCYHCKTMYGEPYCENCYENICRKPHQESYAHHFVHASADEIAFREQNFDGFKKAKCQKCAT